MMPDYKKKEMDLATTSEYEELKDTLPILNGLVGTGRPIKKGERYLVPTNALLSQAWDEQLYYVCTAKRRYWWFYSIWTLYKYG